MIEARSLTKRYGDKVAVSDLSFTVQPGRVTGFLGPNGSGKSTTMRMLLGLDRPDSGTATINGVRYRDLHRPMSVVGALLEARAFHAGRSAYHHLLCLAQTQGLGKDRVDHVIDQVGLRPVAKKRAGGFSLGMGQRLGLAGALLGDPEVLILDEPLNGLDPEGIVWIRNLLKGLAAEGRTVFVSSHLMNEMAVTADHLIVIGGGRLVADCSIEEFTARSTKTGVFVRTNDAARLTGLLESEGAAVLESGPGELQITGLDASQVADIATGAALPLHELTTRRGSLEDAFMEIAQDHADRDAVASTTGGAR